MLGSFTEDASKVLEFLSTQLDTQTQFILSIKRNYRLPKKLKGEKADTRVTIRLSIIIYGPLRTFEEVGDYLDSCEIYLQDPKGCDRNVRYRNPQRLSGLSPHAPFTIDQAIYESMKKSCERVSRSIDYLTEVDAKKDLLETAAPDVLTTHLLRLVLLTILMTWVLT